LEKFQNSWNLNDFSRIRRLSNPVFKSFFHAQLRNESKLITSFSKLFSDQKIYVPKKKPVVAEFDKILKDDRFWWILELGNAGHEITHFPDTVSERFSFPLPKNFLPGKMFYFENFWRLRDLIWKRKSKQTPVFINIPVMCIMILTSNKGKKIFIRSHVFLS